MEDMDDFPDEHLSDFHYLAFELVKQENPIAQFILGKCFRFGIHGIKQDLNLGISLFKQSANKNYTKAQYELAYCYQVGYAIERDIKQAIYWFTKAAYQDHLGSQQKLCYTYMKGEITKKVNVKKKKNVK
jgi:TPR repeat protein